MADDTRERVLNAAGPIFAREGFEGATVREICTAGGVNLASVNYHFGGKEALYLETVKRAHEQKVSRVPLPEWSVDASREEKLHSFIRTILERLLSGGDGDWQTELLIREMIRPTHACKPLVEDFIRPQFDLLLAIVGEFVPPEVSIAERQQLAFSVVGQCLHYRVARGFVSLLVEPQAQSTLLDVERLAQYIAQFSLAALMHWEENGCRTRPTARGRSSDRKQPSPSPDRLPTNHS